MNVRDVGFKKSGSKAMDKDDNVGMFVPKGYAILGYDHDECDEGGRGAQFFHGYHTSISEWGTTVMKAISGNKPGGVYNKPLDLTKKMSSWKVYDLNRSIDFKGVMEGLDSIDSSDSISANKDSYKKTLCQNVDKNYFDADYTVDPETPTAPTAPADPPADPPNNDTDWLLYGGIAAGVCSILVTIILVIVLMMKKKKPI